MNKRMCALSVVIGMILSSLGFANQPVTLTVPTIQPSYAAGSSTNVTYTVNNYVPKPLSVLSISGISPPLTIVSNDCAIIPSGTQAHPGQCNIVLNIAPIKVEAGSTIKQNLQIYYGGRLPLTSHISFQVTVALAHLYVANISGTIGEYLEDGTTVNESLISGVNTPVGIAFGSNGHIYLSTFFNNTIGEYQSDGTTVNASLVTGLSYPYGIAFGPDNGHLYVSNQSGSTIGEYLADGTVVNTSLITGLSNPAGIAFGPNGHLYVVSTYPAQVGEYNLDGTPVNASLITTGLSFPNDIVFGPNGTMYVANNSGAVAEYQADGTVVNTSLITGLSSPRGIAFGPNGNLYVASSGTNTIGEYKPDGTVVNASLITGLSGPYGIVFR